MRFWTVTILLTTAFWGALFSGIGVTADVALTPNRAQQAQQALQSGQVSQELVDKALQAINNGKITPEQINQFQGKAMQGTLTPAEIEAGKRLLAGQTQGQIAIDQMEGVAGGITGTTLDPEQIAIYQRIFGATATPLAIFGHDLFSQTPNTFAPIDNVPVSKDYIVGPGDVINVLIWGRMEASYSLEVDTSGVINFPKIGPLTVAGQTFQEISELIKQKAEASTGVNVNVSMGKLRSIQVFVLGEVKYPGVYTVSSLSTALNALLSSGGPTLLGSLRNVQLKRNSHIAASIDLYDFILKGDTSTDSRLMPGDVIFVPKVGPLVSVGGDVKRPAVYELNGKMNLHTVLDLAGGLAPRAYNQRIQLARAAHNQLETIIDVPFLEVDQHKEVTLHDGDVLKVFSLLPSPENAVFLQGNVVRPGEYAYKSGLLLGDVIPNIEALGVDTYFDYGLIKRYQLENMSTKLIPFKVGDLFSPESKTRGIPLMPLDEIHIFNKWMFENMPQATIIGEVRMPGTYTLKGADLAAAQQQGAAMMGQPQQGAVQMGQPQQGAVQMGQPQQGAAMMGQQQQGTVQMGQPQQGAVQMGQPQQGAAMMGQQQQGTVQMGQPQQGAPMMGQQPQGTVQMGQPRGTIQMGQPQQSAPMMGQPQGAVQMGQPRGTIQMGQPQGTVQMGQMGQPQQGAAMMGQPQGTVQMGQPQQGAPMMGQQPQGIVVQAAAQPGALKITKEMHVRDLVLQAGGLTLDAYKEIAQLYRTNPFTNEVSIHMFNLGKALDGDPEQNITLVDRDKVVIHNTWQYMGKHTVDVQGMVNTPGTYSYAGNMTVRDLILLAGNVQDSAYMGEAELVRFSPIEGKKTGNALLTFNLERALQGDPSHNLALQPWDKLTIKQVSEWRETKNVTISGEVFFPGTYNIRKDERLSSLIERAGGYTDKAYFQGARFTRESVRVSQQIRLDELVNRLAAELTKVQASEMSGVMEKEDVANSAQMGQANQSMIERLRLAKADGRVVIKLSPGPGFSDSSYNIALEEGDQLFIPPKPDTVAVAGEVYNPTSLIFDPAKPTVEYYLEKTGGITEYANTDGTFIIRADGTVVSKSQGSFGTAWLTSFENNQLYPGDTLVVPPRLVRSTWKREMKDISQILFQIAVSTGIVIRQVF